MTIRNGRFQTDDKEEILSRLIDGAERSFGRSFSEDDIHALVQFMDPIAEYFAKQQNDLRDVLDSSHIEHAEGQSLTYVGSLLGVGRIEAAGATTPIQFRSDGPVSRSYTIPSGTGVQTDDADPVAFETTESSTIQYLDGFEENDLSAYIYDTGSFTIQSTTVSTGSYALEATGQGEIINGQRSIGTDSRSHVDIQLTAGAAAGFIYGAEDDANYYTVRVDESAQAVSIEKIESGSATVLGSKSATIPTGEFLTIQLDWMSDATHEAIVTDSSGSEVVTVTADEANQDRFEGNIGFESTTSNTAYYDEATMSRASAEGEARETGPGGNVGPDTLVVQTTSLSGVDDVTNPHGATGGRDKEEDNVYRERIQNELGEGTAATFEAILSALDQLEATRTVTIVVNDDDAADADGRPAHSFEPIVDVDSAHYEDVARTIAEKKCIGEGCVGGYQGTSVTQTIEYSNGQSDDITFSVPTTVELRINLELTKTEQYAGDDVVSDSIVRYTGGELSTGENTDGELSSGDDIIYNQVLEAVMDVEGVYDATTLEIYTPSTSAGTSNISISDGEVATAIADNLDVSSSDV